jgi:CheY-like chemotaxis protein
MSQSPLLPLSPISFLIVTVNPHMASILQVLLKALGAGPVRTCSDAAGAFEAVRQERPDIVLADHVAERLDGLAFTRGLRRGQAAPDLPVILISAHGERRRLAEARDAGVDEVLLKPVDARDLLHMVQNLLRAERLFIRAPGYVGPDRRGGSDPAYGGPERRGASGPAAADGIAKRLLVR